MVKTILKYTSLNVLGMLSISIYILVDTLFISNIIGPLGLASLNLSIVIYSLITGLSLMIGIGGATLWVRTKDNQFFVTSLFLGIGVSVVMMVGGVFFTNEVVNALQANEDIFDYTFMYVRTILLFSPLFVINTLLIAFVRHDKNPKLAMSAMVLSSGVNILFDFLFMVVFKMGMFGAALATSVAPIGSLLLLSTHFILNRNHRLGFKKMVLKISDFGRIISSGIASFVNESSQALTLFLFNIVILSIHGNQGLGAYGIVANISLILFAIMTGIGQGIQPIIGKYIRKNEIENAIKTINITLKLAGSFSLMFYVIILFFNESIIGLFTNDQAIQHLAKKAMSIYFSGLLFASVNVVVGLSFNVMGQSKKAFIISIMRGFVLIIPSLFILSRLFGYIGVFISFVLTEGLVSVLALSFFKKNTIGINQSL
ncbi:MAG: MATE family efflux transporter [Acholeplasma sp.]|nr:MATE family efflux transporter [Acholeplasma sp.]